MMTSDLGGLSGIKIIERESLEKGLQEQALSLTGLTEEGSVIEVGKLVQADQLIYGAYIINDDIIRIDMKLVSVESGTILYIQLLIIYSQKNYQQLKTKGEEFLMTYPDYRMIETVEGWYKLALEKLSGD